jgi:hypothetical protein
LTDGRVAIRFKIPEVSSELKWPKRLSATPSPLRERAGVRVKVTDISPPQRVFIKKSSLCALCVSAVCYNFSHFEL